MARKSFKNEVRHLTQKPMARPNGRAGAVSHLAAGAGCSYAASWGPSATPMANGVDGAWRDDWVLTHR